MSHPAPRRHLAPFMTTAAIAAAALPLLVLAVPALPASAAALTIERVSVSSLGEQGNLDSGEPTA